MKYNDRLKDRESFDSVRRFNGRCQFKFGNKKGELVGLIIERAGKTTVFNMLTGVYKPSEGRILVQDRNEQNQDIGQLHPYQITALGMARTFQNIRLFKNLTVLDNVRIGNHLNVKYKSVEGIFR